MVQRPQAGQAKVYSSKSPLAQTRHYNPGFGRANSGELNPVGTFMATDDDEAGPGFFSLHSVHPSEIGDDGSYVFVDPDNDSQTGSERFGRAGSASTQRLIKTPQRIATTIWAWALLVVLTTALLLLPLAAAALFGGEFCVRYFCHELH